MDTENKGVFFPLDEESYTAVCKVANTQDKTLGQALSFLIAEGAKAIDTEATSKPVYSLDDDTLESQVEKIYMASELVRDEVSSLLFYIERTKDVKEPENPDYPVSDVD
jgi:hypothetical protein